MDAILIHNHKRNFHLQNKGKRMMGIYKYAKMHFLTQQMDGVFTGASLSCVWICQAFLCEICMFWWSKAASLSISNSVWSEQSIVDSRPAANMILKEIKQNPVMGFPTH